MLPRCFLDCSVVVGGFCHRAESDIFVFLMLYFVRCRISISCDYIIYIFIVRREPLLSMPRTFDVNLL